MQSTETYVAENGLIQAATVISWTSWPIRDQWQRCWGTMAVFAFGALVLGWMGNDWFMGAIGLLAVAITLWRMWLPVEYELGPRGIIVTVLRRQRRTPWSAVQRCCVRRHGLLFLPTSDESLLAPLQGLYVPSRDRHSELVAIVHQYLGSRRIR